MLGEAERSIHDALCVIRCLVKKKFVIAGECCLAAGCCRLSIVLLHIEEGVGHPTDIIAGERLHCNQSCISCWIRSQWLCLLLSVALWHSRSIRRRATAWLCNQPDTVVSLRSCYGRERCREPPKLSCMAVVCWNRRRRARNSREPLPRRNVKVAHRRTVVLHARLRRGPRGTQRIASRYRR